MTEQPHKKPVRRRNHNVTIRMTDAEYADLQSRISASGLSLQSYMLKSIFDGIITPSDEIKEWTQINRTFSEYENDLRILTLELKHIISTIREQGGFQAENELLLLIDQLQEKEKEGDELWRSIRQLISQQKR